jgi:hypothetical protein
MTQLQLQKDDYVQLSKMGTSFGLSFSCQELLHDSIIALDGLKRKLLIAQKSDALKFSHIIDLGQVRSISVKKIYRNIIAGALRFKKMEDFLETMHLQFSFKNDRILLPVYKSGAGSVNEVPDLEKKARNWQTLLSKLIKR